MTAKYEQFFGFSSPIFGDTIPQDEHVFRTAAADELFRELEIALFRKDSAAIVAGASGTGKTTLAAEALRSIHTRLAFTAITSTPQNGDELLEQLLTDFGFEPAGTSRVERLQVWRQFLSEMAATDSRVCLLIENAEKFSEDVLCQLHELTASDAAMTPGANVVLTTCRPAEESLAGDPLLPFSQRVRLRWTLVPLTADEVTDYLAFKCRNAGAVADEIFATDFAGLLHALSGGVIRLIDNLVESALLSGAAAGESPVGADRLARIASQQFGMSPIEPTTVLEPKVVNDMLADADAIPTLTDVIEESDIGLSIEIEGMTAGPDAISAAFASHRSH